MTLNKEQAIDALIAAMAVALSKNEIEVSSRLLAYKDNLFMYMTDTDYINLEDMLFVIAKEANDDLQVHKQLFQARSEHENEKDRRQKNDE